MMEHLNVCWNKIKYYLCCKTKSFYETNCFKRNAQCIALKTWKFSVPLIYWYFQYDHNFSITQNLYFIAHETNFRNISKFSSPGHIFSFFHDHSWCVFLFSMVGEADSRFSTQTILFVGVIQFHWKPSHPILKWIGYNYIRFYP